VLHGLKTGSEVLKQINQEMNLEGVEKLLEETQEARAYQEVGQYPSNTPGTQGCPQEISNMLANNLTLDDEEAVQEQFKELQVLAVSSPLITVAAFPLTHIQALKTGPKGDIKLPDVPDTQPVRVKTPGAVSFYHSACKVLGSPPIQDPQVEEPTRERVPVLA